MSDDERNPQAIESTNVANPFEPLSEAKVGDTELLEGDSPAPGVCRVVMVPPESLEKDKELDRKATERMAQVHAGAAELAAQSASPFKTDVPTPINSEAVAHPMEAANMALNTAGTAISESLSSAQDSADATLSSAKNTASSTLASAQEMAAQAKDASINTLSSAKDSTLASAQRTTTSALTSAQDTAASTLAAAQKTSTSALASAQETAASALASVAHAGETTLHKAQDLGSATATVAARSMHATQDTAASVATTTVDQVRRLSAALASTAAEMLHSAEETAARVAVQVLESVEQSIEVLRDQYVGPAQAVAQSQVEKDVQDRDVMTEQCKTTSVKDELGHVADTVVASAEDMLRTASEGSAATLGLDPNVQVEVTPGTANEPSDVASIVTTESSDAGEQAPVKGYTESELLVIRDGLPADKDSERAARKLVRAMEKETAQELMEEDDTASMTA